MITINDKVYRNLEEQVLKNQKDIEDILEAEKVLADFGIQVIGQFDSYDDLIAAYPEQTWQGTFGMACAVGVQTPYNFYVWTRTSDSTKLGIWFNIGTFPQPGPQGIQGVQGEQGNQGDPGQALLGGVGAPSNTSYSNGTLYLNATTGAVYQLNAGVWGVIGNIRGPQGANGSNGQTGATGPQGPQGPKGDTGDVGGFINIQGHIDAVGNLPNPLTITDRTWAFLVGDNNELYIQVPTTPGGSQYIWQNFGELNLGTYVVSSGQYQNVWDADSKLDKVTGETSYIRAYVKQANGSQDTINVSQSPLGLSLVLRDANSRSQVNEPSADKDIANKKYVDDNLPRLIRG